MCRAFHITTKMNLHSVSWHNALTTASNRSQGWCVRLWDDVEIRQFLADDFGGGSGTVGVTVDNDVDTFEGPATRYAGEVVVGA